MKLFGDGLDLHRDQAEQGAGGRPVEQAGAVPGAVPGEQHRPNHRGQQDTDHEVEDPLLSSVHGRDGAREEANIITPPATAAPSTHCRGVGATRVQADCTRSPNSTESTSNG